ncbi:MULTISPECIES: FAD-dependent oxidoreductase [unclassified Shinella]|uniref:FAD/NAD(P)-binding protein n=1 Tax=unclassified Shinella TaxID=2643062 RepID=UPI00225CC1B8|nr:MULTISPECIES: FAD-dependent oxidoreductase [unclassified Shinella]MCO5137796.1 FAD/NAD(P)-binding protein [Shinella sp.]CAI0335336.1 Hydroxyacylglutathione hydrolase [Rhizobiaceae bacterium]CAK7259646.1 FAD/NAD(P)-binding protein [Shinella sp. WSC3-e]
MPARPVVAIIGGGFTGAACAYHLVRRLPVGAARIVVFEPRAMLGGGLAYDTDEATHRINVPATRMSLLPDDGDHFQRWLVRSGTLADDPEAITPEGHAFARRSAFGRYVSGNLAPLVASGAIEHRRSRVRAVTAARSGRWHVEAGDGPALEADIVVAATTHPSPQPPATLHRALSGRAGYIPDATVPGALSGIAPDDRVLVVGTGLTAADVIATLDAAGHRGRITAVSRRGLRSRGHNLSAQEPFGEFADPPSRTARALLRRIREGLVQADAAGLSWHAVFDRVRGQGGDIWRSLPVAERRRVARFLRPYWDVHRFRIAPQVEAVIDRRLAAGTLSFHAAAIAGVTCPAEGGIAVDFRPRHGREPFQETYGSLIVTTGPGHASVLSSQPFLAGLATAGELQPDAVGLGIAVDERSRAIGTDGQALNSLYIAGPLARGTFGELMGLPQVTDHAVFVAEDIVRQMNATGTWVEKAGRGGTKRALRVPQ